MQECGGSAAVAKESILAAFQRCEADVASITIVLQVCSAALRPRRPPRALTLHLQRFFEAVQISVPDFIASISRQNPAPVHPPSSLLADELATLEVVREKLLELQVIREVQGCALLLTRGP
jgi:hypothetical protein